MDLAYMMVGTVVFGIAVGYWLDGLFQTRPWILLSLTLLGVMTGFWSVIKRAYYTSDLQLKAQLEAKEKTKQTGSPSVQALQSENPEQER